MTAGSVAADVVVVGAGAAGCVMARRLAEAGLDVVLLEAGPVRAPARAGLLDVGPGSTVVTRYPAELAGVGVELPRGHAPGGSGAVNGGYCVPARPADVAGWGPDWPRRYAVGTARAAERLRPTVVPRSPAAQYLADAFPGRVSAVAQARRGGRRVTAFDAWDPAGAGVRVHTGARVTGLRWAGRGVTPGGPGSRCVGVEVDDGDDAGRVISAREVVLCAGTIGTAALLLGSGLGPGSGLAVGRGVQEHPELLLDLPAGLEPDGAVAPDTDPADTVLPPLLTHVVRVELPDRSSCAPATASEGGPPEIELRPYSVALHRVIPGLDPQPHRLGVALMNPVGRGEITARPGSPGVGVRLARDPRDTAALETAAALVARRLGLPGRGDRPGDGPAWTLSTSHHLSGSARIGEVVDGSGRVFGVGGLRVADASVLPALPRCGPYYSVLAVAEDLAARVVAEWT